MRRMAPVIYAWLRSYWLTRLAIMAAMLLLLPGVLRCGVAHRDVSPSLLPLPRDRYPRGAVACRGGVGRMADDPDLTDDGYPD